MKENVNILGTEYRISVRSDKDDPKLLDNNGYCDQYSKEIVLCDMEEAEKDVMCVGNLEELKNKILRHEIIHAFFGESGLRGQSEYAENEELIDWIAIQSPKIFKVFQELGII